MKFLLIGLVPYNVRIQIWLIWLSLTYLTYLTFCDVMTRCIFCYQSFSFWKYSFWHHMYVLKKVKAGQMSPLPHVVYRSKFLFRLVRQTADTVHKRGFLWSQWGTVNQGMASQHYIPTHTVEYPRGQFWGQTHFCAPVQSPQYSDENSAGRDRPH